MVEYSWDLLGGFQVLEKKTLFIESKKMDLKGQT